MSGVKQLTLIPYLDIMHRHRLSLVCTLVVGLSLTAVAAIKIPNVYQSSTLVMIEPQQVPAEYVAGSITSHLQDRLHALSQEVLSRTQLEDIIKKYDLYRGRRASHEAVENTADYMRKHIELEMSREDTRAAAGGGSFRLSFETTDPETAQRVTARLADLFINRDLNQRTQQAAATTQFLDDQLASNRNKLEAKSRDIRDFKDHNQGSLPQDLDVNLKTLGTLQAQLQTNHESLTALQERQLQLDREVAQQRQQNVTITSPNGEKSSASPEAALSAMETQLTVLRAQYSDQYPDVVSLKARIAALKDELKSRPPQTADTPLSPVDQTLARERDMLEISASRLRSELGSLRQQIAEVQQRIADTPAHDQQLASLNRDYTVLNQGYHTLLDKKMSAQMSQNLEDRQQGERFKVLDGANLPRRPEIPDKNTIALCGVLLSIAAAIGMPFLLFFTDTSFKHPDDLRAEFHVAVAATIPEFREVSGNRASRVILARAIAISVACFLAGTSAVWLYSSSLV